MNRRFITNIFFFLFAFAVTCFDIKTALPFYAPAIENNKTENLSDKTNHPPAVEFDGIHIPVTGGHINAQKNLLQFNFSGTGYFQKNIPSENLQIKESALLIKDYLSYIYPSHNFW